MENPLVGKKMQKVKVLTSLGKMHQSKYHKHKPPHPWLNAGFAGCLAVAQPAVNAGDVIPACHASDDDRPTWAARFQIPH